MNLVEIEKSIEALPEKDLANFRHWFYEFEHKKWDKLIENDVKSGKLDFLKERALSQFNFVTYSK